ncbi:MAG: hypothetical protein ACK5LV_02750 [Lachnospirales bacterium]
MGILKKVKKYTAITLAMVLSINLLGGYFPSLSITDEVYGASSYGLTGTFDKALANYSTSQYPQFSDVGNPENTDMLLKWNNNGEVLKQNIKIPIENGRILNIDVLNDDLDDRLNLNISYLDADGKPIETAKNIYKIYYPTENAFIDYETYISTYNNNTGAKVLDSTVALENVTDAKFEITSGTGFSIMYAGRQYRFLWKDGVINFYLYSDVKDGFVYDVLVDGENQGYFTKGIDMDTFTSRPYANDDKYEFDKIFHKEVGDEWPGEAERGIEMEFNSIKWYDYTTNTFVSEGTNPVGDLSLQFNIGGESDKKFIVRLLKILGDDISVSSDYTTVDTEVSKTGDVVKVKVKGLDEGIIYTNNVININKGAGNATKILFDTQSLPTEKSVYTFPYYEIIQYDGSFYMNVTPFVDENGNKLMGSYALYSNVMPDDDVPSIDENRSGFSSLVRVNYDGEQSDKDIITFPLSIRPIDEGESATENAKEYYIEFNINETADTTNEDSTKFYSQVLYYEPEEDTSVLGTPDDFTVEYYNKALKYEDGDRVEHRSDLELNISWILGEKTDILSKIEENGGVLDITYTLEKSLQQDLSGEWDESARFKVKLTKSGEDVAISVTDENDGKLYRIVGTPRVREEVISGETYVRAYVDFLFESGDEYANQSDIEFLYPNIYFLNLNYIEIDNAGREVKYTSVLEDITLNDEEHMDVPSVSNVVTNNVVTSKEDEERVSFDLNWDTSGKDIYNYLKTYYTDEQLEDVSIKAHYNIYLSQEESNFKSTFYDQTHDERVYSSSNTSGEAIPFAYSDLYKPNSDTDTRIILNNIGSDTISVSPKPIEIIREYTSKRPYVAIEKMMIDNATVESFKSSTATIVNNKLTIDGLDPNTRYYGFIELVIEHEDLNDGDHTLIEYSIPSAVFAEITKEEVDPPKPSDVDPKIPVVTVTEVGIRDASFLISPYITSVIEGFDQKIQYEVLRLESKKLDEAYYQNKSIMSIYMDEYLKDYNKKEAFKINGDVVTKYNKTSNVYESTNDAIATLNDDGINFKDVSLDSNQIYYYYFRTEKTVTNQSTGEVIKTYSVWLPLNVTTSAILPPKNLAVKQDESFDTQKEVVLEFDGLISDLDTLGVNDFFQLSMRKEGEDWGSPITLDSNILKKSAGVLGENGYRHFVYKIIGLDPGTTYYFKVRHIQQDGTVSIYSDSVRWKTDLGDDYDIDSEVGEWEEVIKDAIEDLLDTDEWILNENNYIYDVLYKNGKWGNVTNGLQGKTVKLKPMQSNKINHFYIPAYIYEQVLNGSLNLEVDYENITLNLRNAFVDNYNTSLINIKNSINNGDTSDYYVKITLSPQSVTTDVNGQTPITDKILLNTELVAFNTDISGWEEYMDTYVTEELLAKYEDHKLKTDIEEAIEDGATAEEILEIIRELESDLLEDAMVSINKSFANNTQSKYTQDITTYSKPIQITVDRGTNDKATGYSILNSNYMAETTTNNGTDSSINKSSDGEFIFTGASYNIAGSNVSSTDRDLIAGFDLYDDLAVNGEIDYNSSLTNDMLAKTYASINNLDYTSGTNSLNQVGVSINDRNKNRTVTNSSAISTVMSIYENKTNNSTSSYRVSNYPKYNQIKGIVGDDKSAKSLYVASELGLYTGSDYFGAVTVGDYINMLTSLQKAIGY